MIEFHCPHCDKLLKTSDEKSGREAVCPGCGQNIAVPFLPQYDATIEDEAFESEQPSRQSTTPEFESPYYCRHCGDPLKQYDPRCGTCGAANDDYRSASDKPGRRREMRPFPPGEVISEASRIFTSKMGLLIVAFLIKGFLIFLMSIPSMFVAVLAQIFFDQNDIAKAIVWGSASAALSLLSLALWFYLEAGSTILHLKVAREQPASLGDLFSGGRFTLRLALSSLIYYVLIGIGFIACFIPALLVMVVLFPFSYVLVDRDAAGVDCLTECKRLTDGNWGSLLLIIILGWACYFAGEMACYVGLIFAVPFVQIMFALAYDRMIYQNPDRSNSPSLNHRARLCSYPLAPALRGEGRGEGIPFRDSNTIAQGDLEPRD